MHPVASWTLVGDFDRPSPGRCRPARRGDDHPGAATLVAKTIRRADERERETDRGEHTSTTTGHAAALSRRRRPDAAVDRESRGKLRRDRKTVRTAQHAEAPAVVLFCTCGSMSYPQYKIRRISNCDPRSTSDHSPPDATTERGRLSQCHAHTASRPRASQPSARATSDTCYCRHRRVLFRNFVHLQ